MKTGTDENPILTFNFTGLKGADGASGQSLSYSAILFNETAHNMCSKSGTGVTVTLTRAVTAGNDTVKIPIPVYLLNNSTGIIPFIYQNKVFFLIVNSSFGGTNFFEIEVTGYYTPDITIDDFVIDSMTTENLYQTLTAEYLPEFYYEDLSSISWADYKDVKTRIQVTQANIFIYQLLNDNWVCSLSSNNKEYLKKSRENVIDKGAQYTQLLGFDTSGNLALEYIDMETRISEKCKVNPGNRIERYITINTIQPQNILAYIRYYLNVIQGMVGNEYDVTGITLQVAENNGDHVGNTLIEPDCTHNYKEVSYNSGSLGEKTAYYEATYEIGDTVTMPTPASLGWTIPQGTTFDGWTYWDYSGDTPVKVTLQAGDTYTLTGGMMFEAEWTVSE